MVQGLAQAKDRAAITTAISKKLWCAQPLS
jgi:hypothetical protein